MVTFLIEGEFPNLYLRFHDHEEDEDTILAAHPPLHRGYCPPWGALSSQDSGGDMSWTPREISLQYALVGRGFRGTLESIYQYSSTSSWRISLWDLYKLSGLPIAGYLMDELVPSAKCLSSSLDKKERIPESFHFLLHAYHSLVSSSFDSSVSPTEWISF
ncbi:hypothetical protein LIER_11432 [Lithospermum erythrorhizon]|uniref:Uncharacterized protein n=1 Tax=Lithospermum erythrorhizon TaxID=34254 RepID=A0AAV3PPU1_LITER